MDEDKKYVRVAAKLFVEQTDKVGGGIAIVQSQRAAQPSYSGPLSGFRRDLAVPDPAPGVAVAFAC